MKNLYGVPKRQWRKWNETAKLAFIRTYEILLDSSKPIYPIPYHDLGIKTKRVVAWNAAWMLANEMHNQERRVVFSVYGVEEEG